MGGVYDSWDNGGPGKFLAKNSGSCDAKILIYPMGGQSFFGQTGIAWSQSDLPATNKYALAFATNCTAAAPSWTPIVTPTGQWMSTLKPGEYLAFDLKFLAPLRLAPNLTWEFGVLIEAMYP